MAISVLERGLDNIDGSASEEFRRIGFLVEQLKLVTKRKLGRHYTPELTILAFMIHASSPASHDVIVDENILCLPSTSTLKEVTRRLDNNSAPDNNHYPKLRVSELNQFERTVLLIVDEIYIAKRIEYAGQVFRILTG